MAMPAMPKTTPSLRGLVLGQPGQAEDEQQGSDDVGRLTAARRAMSMPWLSSCENMASMRRVTAKPPKMLMLASRTAANETAVITMLPLADLQQGADDDDPGDRVGHRHQRGVQGVVHVARSRRSRSRSRARSTVKCCASGPGATAMSRNSDGGRRPATSARPLPGCIERLRLGDGASTAGRRRRVRRRPARAAAARSTRRRAPRSSRAARRRRSRARAAPSLAGVSSLSRLTMLVPYSWEAWAGSRPGRSV